MYADCFGVVGTTYGAGSGSKHLMYQIFVGALIAGKDDMGGSSADRLTNQSGGLDGDVLGNVGGAGNTHASRGRITSTIPTVYFGLASINSNYASGITGLVPTSPGGGNVSLGTGGDTAHNNVQPTIILTYIIKT